MSTKFRKATVIYRFIAASITLVLFAASISVTAHAGPRPLCQSPDSDLDGDGWGWENNGSCIVAGSTADEEPDDDQSNYCLYLTSDEDGDGYGWENNASCEIGPDSSGDVPVEENTSYVPVLDTRGRAICQLANADPDGDGYGWENSTSCVVSGSDVDASTATPARAVCTSSAADIDGDGWGWENGDTCVVQADNSDGSGSDPDTGSDPNDGSDAGSGSDTDDGSDTGNGSDPDDNSDTGNGSDPDDGSDTGNGSDTDDGSDTGNGSDSDYGSDTGNGSDTDDDQLTNQPPYQPSDITDLILVTGQSNTLGANSTVDYSLDAPDPRVFAYTSEGWQVAELYQSWDNGGHPGTGNRDDVSKIHNNFALHFSKRLTELDDKIVVGFVLVSEPGEGILHWSPTEPGMKRVQQKTVAAINELPHKSGVDGILWHQGETDWQLEGTSDIDVARPAPTDYYPVRLTALIENLRTENWFDDSRPFICGETINAEGVNTHLNTLNTDNDANTACVEGAGLPAIREGGNHFNADALRILGSRYGDAYHQMR